MKKIIVDLDLFDPNDQTWFGDLEWPLCMEDYTFNTLKDAIEETKYEIDETEKDDLIHVFLFYEGWKDYPNKPIYRLARCSEKAAKRFNIKADEFYGDYREDNEEYEDEPF